MKISSTEVEEICMMIHGNRTEDDEKERNSCPEYRIAGTQLWRRKGNILFVAKLESIGFNIPRNKRLVTIFDFVVIDQR